MRRSQGSPTRKTESKPCCTPGPPCRSTDGSVRRRCAAQRQRHSAKHMRAPSDFAWSASIVDIPTGSAEAMRSACRELDTATEKTLKRKELDSLPYPAPRIENDASKLRKRRASATKMARAAADPNVYTACANRPRNSRNQHNNDAVIAALDAQGARCH